MRFSRPAIRIATHAAIVSLAVLGTSAARAQQAPTGKTAMTGTTDTVKTDIPDSLAKLAKVSEADARQKALARVQHGTVQAMELEREHGKLQYSYDVKVPGKSGITEVNVDAISGKVLAVKHESAATEAKEAAAEGKPTP
jgi:uncharacterized membrane protein YkoI